MSIGNLRVFGLWVWVAVVGCADLDGTDPYALWHTYEHAKDRFHFHYLTPPWEEIDASDLNDGIRLGIDPIRVHGVATSSARVVLMARSFDLAEYRFLTEPIEPITLESIVANELAELDAGHKFTACTRLPNIVSAAGDVGPRIHCFNDVSALTALYQAGWQAGAGGGLQYFVEMEIHGAVDVLTSDFELVLEGLEPRGADE